MQGNEAYIVVSYTRFRALTNWHMGRFCEGSLQTHDSGHGTVKDELYGDPGNLSRSCIWKACDCDWVVLLDLRIFGSVARTST